MLASELNVDPEQVVGFLTDAGTKVRGPSAVVAASTAARVRGHFRHVSRAENAASIPAPAVQQPLVEVPAQVSPPTGLFSAAGDQSAIMPAAQPKAFIPAPRTPMPLPAPPSIEAPPEPDYAQLWIDRGFTESDRADWAAAGLRPGEAGLADRCRLAEIAPGDLTRKLSGRTGLQRLRDGESTTSVWARIREAQEAPEKRGTRLAGRFAG